MQIEQARGRCRSLFENLAAVYTPLTALRTGRCGTPAPILLKYLGREQDGALINAPATLNCRFAARLTKWAARSLQPLAMELLGARVKTIHNAASYVCRTRYDRPGTRISEHAFANALDIMSFTLSDGRTVSFLDHWSAQDERADFLHKIHSSACASFGTVLGPDTNEAHKNHIHIDLAKRRGAAYCE